MRNFSPVLALLAAALFSPVPGGCSGSADRAPARRVILITCDTLRADRLGVYGYARPTSPNLDAFAHDAVVFDEAYTSAPWTGPALSSLLSGKLPDEIGVPGGNRFPMPAEAVTLAEIARDAGVRTAAVVSNWVLRRPAKELGDAGVAQGFEDFDDTMTTKEGNRDAWERTAPATTDAAIAWLEREARADQPFFLWVHYQDPHGPYLPPPEMLARFERPPTDEPPLGLGDTHKGHHFLPAYQAIDGERRPEVYRARYDAEIATFDQSLGRLLDWLRAKAWVDDALIVVSADHGESLGEHEYWFCHGENVWREVVRVPLVVRFPKGARHVASEARDGYARVGALAGHLDLWPTILEALGLEGPPNRGTSLFAEHLPEGRVNTQTFGVPGSPQRWTAVSDGRRRLVIEGHLPPRLFDVASDPGETRDLASSSPQEVAELAALGQRFVATHASKPLDPARQKGGEREQHALEKLGYTDGDEHDAR
jgi:arylsulfatase A-like enzyme